MSLPGRQRPRHAEMVLYSTTFINAVGNGVFTVAGTLFFIQVLDFTPVRVGLGLSIAACIGLAVSVPLTRLIEGRALRQIYAGLLVLQGASMVLVITARQFPLFIAATALSAIGHKTGRAVSGALVGLIGGDRRVEVRAISRSVNNAGTALGALASSVAVVEGSDRSYVILILVNAASFVAAAGCVLLLRDDVRGIRTPNRAISALRDLPYVGIAMIDAVLCLEYFVLTFALPLWVIEHTRAPRVAIPLLFAANMLLVALLQVRLSRSARTITGAARSVQRSGWLFLFSLLMLMAAAHVSVVAAIVLLGTGVIVHTVGEMLHAAGMLELSYALAPRGQITEYQAVFGLGMGTADLVAPYTLALICLNGSWYGWPALALVIMAAGWVVPMAARRASRSHGIADGSVIHTGTALGDTTRSPEPSPSH